MQAPETGLVSKMRTIAFRLEQAAAFEDNHACHEQEESDAPPI